MARTRLMGRAGTRSGSQSSLPPASRHGFDAVGRGLRGARPGSAGRAGLQAAEPLRRGLAAPATWPAGLSWNWKALKIGWMRA